MAKHSLYIGIAIILILGGVAFFRMYIAPPSVLQKAGAEPPTAGDNGNPSGLVLGNIMYTDDEKLTEFIRAFGITRIMEHLVEDSGGGSIYDCHQDAHQVGRMGYAVEKERAFESCDPSCHSGCYHGAMESFLNEQGTANLAEKIDNICDLFNTSFGIFECLHGVGHGVLAFLNYDLLATVDQCKSLKDSFSQSSCYGGMFMENILTGQGLGAGEHDTEWVNQTDYHYPCSALPDDYELRYQCYQMQTSWMLTLSGYDFAPVAKECLNAPADMIAVCYKSLGRDAAGNTLRNPQKILELGALVPPKADYYSQFINGALNVIVDFWGPTLKGQAAELCALLGNEEKERCYQVLAGRLPGLLATAESRMAVCLTFEKEFQHLCTE